jgi:hypothetical protein
MKKNGIGGARSTYGEKRCLQGLVVKPEGRINLEYIGADGRIIL